MNKPLLSLLIFFFMSKLYFSQAVNNIDHVYDGEIILESAVEYTSPVGNSDSGLFVELNINNRNYLFLVDTGASISVLNDQVFEEIIAPHKKVKIRDAVGIEDEKDLFYLDFKVGKNLFSHFAFIKYDLSKIFQNNCIKLDGILGANVLKKLNWKFVKIENKLFFSKNSFLYEGYRKPAKVQWAGSVPIVEMKIKNDKFLAIIDSGHFGTLIIPNYLFINNFGFGTYYDLMKGKGSPLSTVNGKQKIDLKKTAIENFTLENYDFSEYEVVLTTKVQPNIGNRIILENGFIFNFLTSEIAFGISEKRSRYTTLPKIKVCKSDIDKKQIELCFFWKEPNTKMLKLRDQIIKIDDIDTQNVDDRKYCRIVDYLTKEGSKKIILKRGNKEIEYTWN